MVIPNPTAAELSGPAAPTTRPDCALTTNSDPFFSGRKHYPELDGLRAVAIIAVIMVHFQEWLPKTVAARTGEPGAAIISLASHGAWGVDLFFVLSGYLITGILLQSRGQKHYFRNFYARRFLRILPLYYGTLLATLLAAPMIFQRLPSFWAGAYRHQFWLWAYLSNFETALHGPILGNFTHFWTLAVEEQFYLAWPLVVLALAPRRLLNFALAAAFVIGASNIVLNANLGAFSGWMQFSSVARMPPLLAGAALAVLASEGLLTKLKAWLIGSLATGMSALLLCSLLMSRGWLPSDGKLLEHLLLAPVVFGGLVGWLVASVPGSPLVRLFSAAPLRSIGKYSYAMYVFHFLYIPLEMRLLPAADFVHRGPLAIAGLLLYFASGVVVAYALAFASYHLYEKHFLKLKKYFPERAGPPQLKNQHAAVQHPAGGI